MQLRFNIARVNRRQSLRGASWVITHSGSEIQSIPACGKNIFRENEIADSPPRGLMRLKL
jgi:hypothetical protein